MARRLTRRLQDGARRFGFDIHRVRAMTESTVRTAKLCQHLSIDLVLDVGAHKGDWAAAIRAAGYSGNIVSIEPQQSEGAHLIARSAADPHWTVERVAAGDYNGTSEIHIAAESDWSSLRTRTGEYRRDATQKRSEPVAVRRIDGLDLPKALRIFAKIDVQGHELDVLAGCSGLADRLVGFQAEVNLKPVYDGQPSVEEMLAAAARLEMRLVGVHNGWTDPQTGRELYLDLIFARGH